MGFFFAKGAAASSSYDTEVLADSPVGYWRLGEASGATAADSSGNGRDGTYGNGTFFSPVLGETGAVSGGNTAALFQPVGTHRVNLGTPAALNITGQLTLECWFKPTAFPTAGQTQYLVGHGYNLTNTGYYLVITETGVQVGSFNGTSHSAAWTRSGWSTGQWRHLAGGYDGTAWKLHVDGVEVASTTDGTGAVTSTAASMIGCLSNNGTLQDYANGTIDEVAVYGAWIGGTRIAAHFAAA